MKDDDEGGGEDADFKLFEGFYFLEDTTENKRFYYSYDCRDLSSYIE